MDTKLNSDSLILVISTEQWTPKSLHTDLAREKVDLSKNYLRRHSGVDYKANVISFLLLLSSKEAPIVAFME
jgi:hypothetical protein